MKAEKNNYGYLCYYMTKQICWNLYLCSVEAFIVSFTTIQINYFVQWIISPTSICYVRSFHIFNSKSSLFAFMYTLFCFPSFVHTHLQYEHQNNTI